MKKLFLLLLLAIFSNILFAQIPAQFNPVVYTKALPKIITVPNQPSDFKMTTHVVNIKVPADSVKNWGGAMELRYIKRLFNIIKDVDCLVLNYSGFYYNDGMSEYSIDRGFSFEVNIQNKIKNIGLSLFDQSSLYNSEKLKQVITLSEDHALHPQIVTHEFFHQWNSFLESAKYWLIDPSHHTGLVEDKNTVFYSGPFSDFKHVSDSIYSLKQGACTGFPGKLEGYLAGLWDMPDELKTLKNYWFYSNLSQVSNEDGSTTHHVKADSIVALNKERLFNLYGGERIPNYIDSKKDFDCAVVVFTSDNFLSDDKLKGFHYMSLLNELEGTATEYNNLYDQVCLAGKNYSDDNYGYRQTNLYHSSFKKLHFRTRLFNDDGTVDLLPSPAQEISGITEISRGDYDIINVIYSIPKIKNATSYIWTLPDGATGTSSTNSISVTYSTSASSGLITVRGRNSFGDGDFTMKEISINQLPANARIVEGITAVSKGTLNVVYTVPEIKHATSYIWTLPSGAKGTSTTNRIVVDFDQSAQSGVISVKGHNLFGEGKPSSLAITIDPLPANAGQIKGDQIICKGASKVIYSVAEIKYATSYIWSLPSGASGSSTTNSISVDYDINAMSGYITVKGHNSSGDGKSSSIPITINALPAIAGEITGLSTVSQGQDLVTYSISPIENATTYNWTLPDGATGSSIINSISVYWGKTAKSGNVEVKGINCAGEGPSSIKLITVNSTNVNILPGDAGSISGPSSVCQGTFATYSVPPIPNATSYTWTFLNGEIRTSSNEKITVYHATNALSGDITVRGTSENGNGVSSKLAITVNKFPDEPGPITGPLSVNRGQRSVVYSVTPISNATSYMWYYNNVNIKTTTTNRVNIDFNDWFVSGVLSVNAINSCGGSWKTDLAITVNSLPEIAGKISGSADVCNLTSAIYSVPSILNATSYKWTLPYGATGTSTTSNITVNFSSRAKSGEISVIGINSIGYGTASTLSINIPAVPIVSSNGNVLHSNVSSGNQWYNQDGIINGATSQNYTAVASGDYHVVQTIGGCISEASNVIHIVATGVEELEANRAIKVYPNPVANELVIEMEGNQVEQSFEVLNSNGQTVFKGCIFDRIIVQMSSFSSGVYLVRFDDGETVEVKKIVKE